MRNIVVHEKQIIVRDQKYVYTHMYTYIYTHIYYIPACLGRALQLSWPCFWMKVMSLKSSAGLQGPLFTWLLSQQGALPFPISLSLSLSLSSRIYLKRKDLLLVSPRLWQTCGFTYHFSHIYICVYIDIYVCVGAICKKEKRERIYGEEYWFPSLPTRVMPQKWSTPFDAINRGKSIRIY